MKRYHVLMLMLLFVATTGQRALALPITGTLGAIPIDLVMDGTDLLTSTLVTGSDILTTAVSGDLAAVPLGTSFGPFTIDTSDLVGGFTFGSATYGSFAPLSAIIGTHTAESLIVTLLGTFTPGLGLPGFDPTPVKIDVALSAVGGEGGGLEGTISLQSVGVVSEPGLWTMLGIGGLGVARQLRRRSR